MVRLGLPSLCFLALAACGPAPGGARVELAAPSADGLAPVPDGAELALVAGPQGGYHLDVGVRMFGFDPDGARLRYEVWDTDRALHLDATYALRRGRFHRVDGHWERSGDRALLSIASPDEIVGRTVDVVVVVELPDGTELSDARAVVVR